MSNVKEDFLHVTDHYAGLVQLLDAHDLRDYLKLRNVRSEPCFPKRTFVIYRMEGREPMQIDHLTVLDFDLNDADGASAEIRSQTLGKTIAVGYKPVRLFQYPIFVHLPLHTKVRWSTTPSNIEGGSLAFDLVVRTMSRLHMRERDVVHCETGVRFSEEFGSHARA